MEPPARPYRRTTMTRSRRRLLSAAAPAALLAVLLAGCGTEGDGDADARGEDASPTASTSPGEPSSSADPTDAGSTSTGGVDFEEVAILHGTAEGGTTATSPVLLDSQAAVDAFASGFSGRNLAEKIRSTYDSTDIPEGTALVAATISVGCDVPPGVTVVSGQEGLQVIGKKVVSPLRECFAPVTSVALVLVDAGAVG